MLPLDILETLYQGKQVHSIDIVDFPAALRILVLAPHPDDFDAIGVTLRYFQTRGNEIELAVLSGGSKGVQDDPTNPLTRTQKTKLREEEQRQSCEFFGLPPSRVCFLRLAEAEDGELEHSAANQNRVSTQLEKTAPDILFLPYGDDSNNGHRRAYAMTRAAARRLRKPLLALYNKDAKTVSFRSDLYTGFGEARGDWKRTLLCYHDTQQRRNLESRGYGFDDRILRFNQQLARELKLDLPYAEAFQIELFLPHQPA